MKRGRVKGGSIIPATIDTGRRFRSNMAQPIRNMAGSPRGTQGGAAQNIIEITSDDLVQNGGQYKLMGGTPLPMQIVNGRRSKQGPAQVVYPVDALGNYDPTFAGYIHKVLTPDEESGYDPSSLIGFWPQNELAGGVSIDYSGLGHDGAYTAVTLGQPGVPGFGMSSAGYDGATSFNNIYSASLNTAFDGAEGTILAWAQVANVGVWTDAANRRIARCRADANNVIEISIGVNLVDFNYRAGGVTDLVQVNTTTLDYFVAAIVWSATSDTVDGYLNAVPGVQRTVLGVWAGPLDATRTIIGASFTAPAAVFSGNIGPTLLFNEAKTPAEIAYLSTP